MVPLAPRYDPRLLTLVAELDDRSEPIAEINRRIGVAAVQLGLIQAELRAHPPVGARKARP
jgi:hypothetical protein